jgi:hypothetical protein
MDDSEITALAKGIVPFVRECVAEAFGKAVVTGELAIEVANAVRLLHESPPIAEHKETPQPSPPRVARIERDEYGNLVPIYNESRS